MAPNTEHFNNDELQPPEWLNDEFFLKVLYNCEDTAKANGLQLIQTKISPASQKGDHYASIMFRAALDYRLNDVVKSRSLIIKTMPELEGHKKEMVSESHIFETEIGMYAEVLPRLERILREAGDDTVLKAACLYHSLSPKKVIVFEDIVPLGYEVIRGRFVNIDELKLAYAKLAKLHATSYKINKEEPHYFDKYCNSMLDIPNIMDDEMMTSGIRNFIDFLSETPALRQYVPYFEPFRKNLLQKCLAGFHELRDAPKADGYYAMCHGDFHGKNMMFKHDPVTGKCEDVMLLDYQVSYVGPIVNDLLYSQYLLLDADLRKIYPEILHHYFTVFGSTLKKIGFQGEMPKLVRLRQQFLEHKHYEFFLATSVLPMIYAFLDPKTNLNDLMTSNDYRRTLYPAKVYTDELHELLPKLLHLGYFED
ncbi:uncharacterized protein LOC129251129 [Anastrepha obliqua]|uniref:uncharacterized protein LOC129251129 n=1 Tax=Anastrepha obliqua TaxID=95512 RepID=UPI00240A5DEA|nr:uncharacterized protein LOC129251129 [Anastrepha obliqua]